VGESDTAAQLRLARAEAASARTERDELRRRLDGMPVVSAATLRRGGALGSHDAAYPGHSAGAGADTPVKVLPLGEASTARLWRGEPPQSHGYLEAGGEEESGFVAVRTELREAADRAARVIAQLRERESRARQLTLTPAWACASGCAKVTLQG
jgi:hypothetical protein